MDAKYQKIELIIVAVFIAVAGVWAYFNTPKDVSPDSVDISEQKTIQSEKKEGFRIESPSFTENTLIPKQYTCDGQNVHPPLAIHDVPEGAKELALVVEDTDVPQGSFIHWVVWNIAPHTTAIQEGQVPEKATEGTTGRGRPGFFGPCPPTGTHRYFFRLYALDTVIGLDSKGTQKELEQAMQGHIVGSATLMGRYHR